ncbi:hypothetical protein, partial [Pseudomonas viridiflava]|uniref:hypothetical protein n=1 Tax=Pseudomonas viridiflava TaxID=33069 RepID=UPI0013DF8CC8
MYISNFATAEEVTGPWGEFLIDQMRRMDSDLVVRNIGWIEKDISAANSFGHLAVELLQGESTKHTLEKITRILRNLDREIILVEKSTLEKIVLQ